MVDAFSGAPGRMSALSWIVGCPNYSLSAGLAQIHNAGRSDFFASTNADEGKMQDYGFLFQR